MHIRWQLRALPMCRLTLTTAVPANYIYAEAEEMYPVNPKTIGERIRKRRMDVGMQQKDLAELMGRTRTAVWKWEHNQSIPNGACRSAVIAFLGYDPYAKKR